MTKKPTTALLFFALMFNTLVSFAQRKDVNLVFIGNSITYGSGLSDRLTQAPPVICAAYIKAEGENIGMVDYSNQGHSGYTTLDWLPGTPALNNALAAARDFSNQAAQLVFSIKIGTNDSAVKGPHGAPVSVTDYELNLKTITDHLLKNFAGCKVVIHHPIWYSPTTQNGSVYLQQGLDRLQTYVPVIDRVVKSYKGTNPNQVFVGDTKAFDYFKKNYKTDHQVERGSAGIFYLHPNTKGAEALGQFWGKAILKALK